MVDLADIRSLADRGIAAFPPSRLGEAAAWLNDFGAATGEARYLVLGSTLSMVHESFEEAGGQMLTATVETLDVQLRETIPTNLDAEDIGFASVCARNLHEAVARTIQAG